MGKGELVVVQRGALKDIHDLSAVKLLDIAKNTNVIHGDKLLRNFEKKSASEVDTTRTLIATPFLPNRPERPIR